jgi:hypothetical protein
MKKAMLAAFVAVYVLIAGQANADFVWGTPVNLGPSVNSSYGEHGVCISADGLEFYFMSNRPGGYGDYDLWVRKRATVEDDWGSPVNAGSPPNSQYSYWEPTISADGLSLYFSDGHSPQFGNHLPGGLGGDGDIWMLARETVNDAWGAPVNIGPAVNSQHAVSPSLSADGLSLYFQSHRPGHIGEHCDIMVATRATTSDPFGSPVFLSNVNSLDGEWMPDISADGRTIFFSRSTCTVLWMATRATVHDDFGPPVRLPAQINLACTNASPTLSADGRTLYFGSDRAGGMGSYDLWQASITPIVDFTGDGIVNLKDFARLAQYWKQNQAAVDVGPTPLGDGTIDYRDLAVFAEQFRIGGRPEQASGPNPSDGAMGVSTTAFLTWTAGDGAELHEVYFGTAHPLPLVSTETDTTYAPPVMAKNTTYYWRIDEVNGKGKTTGQTWSFITETGGTR